MFMAWKTQHRQMATQLPLTEVFSAASVKTPAPAVAETHERMLKFAWKREGPRGARLVNEEQI